MSLTTKSLFSRNFQTDFKQNYVIICLGKLDLLNIYVTLISWARRYPGINLTFQWHNEKRHSINSVTFIFIVCLYGYSANISWLGNSEQSQLNFVASFIHLATTRRRYDDIINYERSPIYTWRLNASPNIVFVWRNTCLGILLRFEITNISLFLISSYLY